MKLNKMLKLNMKFHKTSNFLLFKLWHIRLVRCLLKRVPRCWRCTNMHAYITLEDDSGLSGLFEHLKGLEYFNVMSNQGFKCITRNY